MSDHANFDLANAVFVRWRMACPQGIKIQYQHTKAI